ncbi:MAG: TetR/AcrR family transcriptional regulator [Propionibacteriales bacterium]|nr:TetR/AcrR family transcriptional regulator [Propionibacteriales bacterium]
MTPPEPPLKERLLTAAMDALRDLTAVDLLNAVGTREIARRAGGSAPSIHHHYGSLEGLASAVLAHVYDPALGRAGEVVDLLEAIEDAHLPLDAAFAFHGAEFDRLSGDDEFPLRLGLWAFGGRAGAEAYGRYLRERDAVIAGYVDRVFAAWRRELRPPFDLAGFIATKVALVNGTTLRQLVDPDPNRRTWFQRANLALDLVLLRVPGDRHNTDDRLTELNYYPLTKTPGTRESPRTRATKARIMHAAADLFATHGYEATTLEQIAAHADSSLTTLKRHYPGKQYLAVHLFSHLAATLLANPEGTTNRRGRSGADTLEVDLTALAYLVPPRAAMASAYLAHLVTTTSDQYDDPLLALIRPLLPRGTDTHTLSEALVALTIRRALTHPSQAPADNARHVLALVVHDPPPPDLLDP